MFERRSILVILSVLYVCLVVIWRMSAQDAALLQGEAGSGYHRASIPQHLRDELFNGKHLLAESMQANDNLSESDPTALNRYFNDIVRRSPKIADYDNATSSTRSRNSNYSNKTLALSPKLSEVFSIATPKQHPEVSAKFALGERDFKHLIDLQNFTYLRSQPNCSGQIEALILVHSAPKNFKKRQLIRETWGSLAAATSPDSPLRLVFLLGDVVDASLQFDLNMENAHHKDMVQGSFIDDYHNMTYKHLMGFKWFLYNCASAQLLIKTDDDVYLNTPLLLEYWSQTRASKFNNRTTDTPQTALVPTGRSASSSTRLTSSSVQPKFIPSYQLFWHPKNLLFCTEKIGSPVKRSFRSKWRVSVKEYAGSVYPPYCPGYAIIYSSDVVLRLYNAAQQQSYFWIDDVYVTGVLAQLTNTTITTSFSYVLRKNNCEQLLAGKTELSEVEFLYSWHLISPQQIRSLWELHWNALAAAAAAGARAKSAAGASKSKAATAATSQGPAPAANSVSSYGSLPDDRL